MLPLAIIQATLRVPTTRLYTPLPNPCMFRFAGQGGVNYSQSCLARHGSSTSPWDTKPVGEQGASCRFFIDNPNGCLGQ